MHDRTPPTAKRLAEADRGLRPEFCPTLAVFLGGYLHEDFLPEHGSAAAAAYAFAGDAEPEEVARLETEWRLVETLATRLPLAELGDLLAHRFGGAWRPRSKREIAAVGAELRRATREP